MNPRTQIITKLRQEITDLLAEYYYLRTEHFYPLLDASTDTRKRAIRRALQLMRKARLVTAEYIFKYKDHSRGGFPHTSFVYYLEGKRSPFSLAHDIDITEFHLALTAALKLHPYLKLHWLQDDLRKTTNPDAIFGIQDTRKPKDKSTHWFFLEIEKSRQGHWKKHENSGLVQKLTRYDNYRGSRELKADYSYIGDFRVVVTMETPERTVNLLRKLSSLLPYRFIWITTPEAVKQKGALAGIYFTPKDFENKSYSFLDLLSS